MTFSLSACFALFFFFNIVSKMHFLPITINHLSLKSRVHPFPVLSEVSISLIQMNNTKKNDLLTLCGFMALCHYVSASF